jgi:hypothetical protein
MVTNAVTFRDFRHQVGGNQLLKSLLTMSHLAQSLGLCGSEELGKELYFMDTFGECKPRWDAFFEYVMGTNHLERKGIRIWILVHDQNIHFGRGLERLIVDNAMDDARAKDGKRAKPAPKEWELYRYIKKKDAWAYGCVDAYNHNRACYRNPTNIHHVGNTLESELNLANPERVFAAHRHFLSPCPPAVDPTQWNWCSESDGPLPAYLMAEGLDGQEFQTITWPFPEHVFHISPSFFFPHTLFTARLPDIYRGGSLDEQDHHFDQHVAQIIQHRDTPSTHGIEKEPGALQQLRTLVMESQRRGEPFKEIAANEFRKLWHSESQLSSVLKHILVWKRMKDRQWYREETGHPAPFYHLYDSDLSHFDNFILTKMHAIETSLQCSTSHLVLLKTLIFRLDAFRQQFNLHLNFILAGAGASSKSWALDQLTKASIPGTVEEVTYQTSKANAIDGDQNDNTVIYHEFPPALIGVEKGSISDTGDPHFKETLCSGKFKTKTFVFLEDGTRANRTAVSECIGVRGGATNDPPGNIPEAMASRFNIVMCPHQKRLNRGVTDVLGQPLSTQEKNIREEFLLSEQLEQYYVAMVNKLIYVGLLKEPNLDIAHTIFKNAVHYLEKNDVFDAKSPRHFNRLLLTARTLTIMHAQCVLRGHYAADWDEKHLIDIQPLLVCSESIAWFTLSLLSGQYINPLVRSIVEVFAQLCHYEADNTTWGVTSDNNEDYNVLCYNKSLPVTSHDISNAMQGDITASPNQVRYVLKGLRGKITTVPVYGPHGDLGKTHRMPILDCDAGPLGEVRMSVGYLRRLRDREDHNLIQMAIADGFHHHTRPRRILLCDSYINQHCPHLLKTMQAVQKKKILRLTQNRHTQHPFELVNEDYEKATFESYAVECGLPFQACFLPSNRHLPVYRPGSYPTQYLQQEHDKANLLKDSLQWDKQQKMIQQQEYNLSMRRTKRKRGET